MWKMNDCSLWKSCLSYVGISFFNKNDFILIDSIVYKRQNPVFKATRHNCIIAKLQLLQKSLSALFYMAKMNNEYNR